MSNEKLKDQCIGCVMRSYLSVHLPRDGSVVVQLRTAIEELDDGGIAINVQQHPQRRPGVDSLHENSFGLAVETIVQIATGVHVEE